MAEFASPENLHTKLLQFIEEWSEHVHPFNWLTKSVAKVMAGAPAPAAE
jgi:hypothetical protein